MIVLLPAFDVAPHTITAPEGADPARWCTLDVSRVELSVGTGVLAPGSMLAPAFQSRWTVASAGVCSPVTVAGQPRFLTGVPCSRPGRYQPSDQPAKPLSLFATAVTAPLRVLLLGGTTEASGLAEALSQRDDVSVVTSLAGRTAAPAAVPGRRRVGGFGGTDGLVAYLRSERIAAVVDATHPFAEVMRWDAYDACREAGVPRLRLERPRWQAQGGDRWTVVADVAAAAAAISTGPARRVFLTTGRGDLAAFIPGVDGRRWWLVRSIDPPARLPLHPSEVILSRGPFSVEGEAELMERHLIDLVVTKNSGGNATVAKLHAARRLDVGVLVIDRPPSPDGPSVATVGDALEWLCASLGLRPADERRPRPALRDG